MTPAPDPGHELEDEVLDPIEARQAADPAFGAGNAATAPHELPPPEHREPVAIGAAAGAAAVVATLVAADVPWYGAVGLVIVLAVIAAWQRDKVTPYR